MLTEIKIPCVMCDQISYVLAWDHEIEAYLAGKLIQDAFPSLDADERELLISQTCSDCWDKTFPETSDE